MIRALVMVLVRLLLHRQKQGAFAAACVSIPCCLVHANFGWHSKLEGKLCDHDVSWNRNSLLM